MIAHFVMPFLEFDDLIRIRLVSRKLRRYANNAMVEVIKALSRQKHVDFHMMDVLGVNIIYGRILHHGDCASLVIGGTGVICNMILFVYMLPTIASAAERTGWTTTTMYVGGEEHMVDYNINDRVLLVENPLVGEKIVFNVLCKYKPKFRWPSNGETVPWMHILKPL